jgi:hypothetical protein
MPPIIVIFSTHFEFVEKNGKFLEFFFSQVVIGLIGQGLSVHSKKEILNLEGAPN